MEKELIKHIATQLKNHEESYLPGAWERFAAQEEKPKRVLLWPYFTAAAILLVALSTFLIFRLQQKNNPSFANIKTSKLASNNNKSTKIPQGDDSLVKDKTIDYNNRIDIVLSQKEKSFVKNLVKHKAPINTPTEKFLLSLPKYPQKIDIQTDSKNMVLAQLAPSTTPEMVIKPQNKNNYRPKTFEDLLATEKTNTTNTKNLTAARNESKWQPGIYVAPAMGNDNKVNLDYGFSLSYAVAKKLYINSGIAYASLSSTQNLGNNAPQTLTERSLTAVNAKVSGISIPLEFRYKLSEKLYTGVGVSALAILSNSQNNTYVANQVQNVAVATVNGLTEQKAFIVKEKTVEPQPESKVDPDRYIGFYNFSLGYKQKISPKKNLAIEPFYRLPMKRFSKDNLNLANGGLRLKMDF